MGMNEKQLVAMSLAMQTLEKPEDHEARNKIWSGQELNAGDCRALIIACWRSGVAEKSDLNELAEWFFERYGFDDKVRVANLYKVEFS